MNDWNDGVVEDWNDGFNRKEQIETSFGCIFSNIPLFQHSIIPID
jgi:hypothetical protein